jgi:Bax protein
MSLFRKRVVVVSAFFLFFTLACQENQAEKNSAKAQPEQSKTQAPETVEIRSLDELMALFDKLNYNSESWAAGNREVPRLSFDQVRENWKKTSQEIPVPIKKQVFFRLMAPLVLMANEKILDAQQLATENDLADPQLITLAVQYKVIPDRVTLLDEKQRQELLARVDTLPPSLVLAQAAEESGWASSRFTIEGNAFFGQWDFSGKGMIPEKQRKVLGNYGLARFDTPRASVEAYMFNINTHNAYQRLRTLRAKLRANGKLVTGIELAGTLDKYSERGQAYIDGLIKMIRFNKLEPVDEAYLSDKRGWRLISKAGE